MKMARYSPVSASKIATLPSRAPTASKLAHEAQEAIVGASAPFCGATLNS